MLTSVSVQKAAASEGQIIWDGASGLGLKCNAYSRVFVVQARDPSGRSVRRTLGDAVGPDAITLGTVRKLARAARSQIESGSVPEVLRKRDRREPAAPVGALTFGSARDAYLALVSDPGNAAYLKSWRSVATLLHRDEFAEWEHRPLASLTRADVKQTFNAMVDGIARRAEGHQHVPGMLRRGAGISANRALSALSSLFRWAAARDGFSEPLDKTPLTPHNSVGGFYVATT